MLVYVVEIKVIAGMEANFLRATQLNHRATRQEPGNVRFDLVQSISDPSRFLLYEVYRSPADVVGHKSAEHYLKWRETVADMMAEPRTGREFQTCLPEALSGWLSQHGA
jgi:autoinducer 2-degrading protein